MCDEGRVKRVGRHPEEEALRAELPEMREDEDEHDRRGQALKHPIAAVAVPLDLAIDRRPAKQHQPVDGVEAERQDDEQDFDEREQLPALDSADDVVVVRRAAKDGRVRQQVLDEECGEHDRTGYGVKCGARAVESQSSRAQYTLLPRWSLRKGDVRSAGCDPCTYASVRAGAKRARKQPEASLSQTSAAAADFLPIHEAWETRQATRESIAKFPFR